MDALFEAAPGVTDSHERGPVARLGPRPHERVVLHAQDATFTDHQIALARSVVEDARSKLPVRGAYVSGSLAAGLGNPNSDVDLYLLLDGNATLGNWQPMLSGQRLDVHYLNPAQLDEMVAGIRIFSVTKTQRDQLFLSRMYLQDAVRFLLGRDVMDCDDLTRQRRSVDLRSLRHLLMVHGASRAANAIEDAHGAVMGGDWATAISSSELAVQEAGETLLSCHGDFYVSPTYKFLFRRLGRLGELDRHNRRAWSLLHRPLPSTNAMGTTIRGIVVRRLLFCGWIISNCLLDGWQLPKPFPGFALHHRGPVRNPYFGLLRFGDGLGLYGLGPGSGYSLSEQTAKLWSLIDGSSVEWVTRRYASWAAVHPHAVKNDVRESLENMRQVGAVVASLDEPVELFRPPEDS